MDVIKKLKIGAGQLYTINVPQEIKETFEEVDTVSRLSGEKPIGQVVLFAKDKAALEDGFSKVLPRLEDDALLWIAYPKKSGSIQSDITRDAGWDTLTAAHYIPVTQVAIDSDWSALRFRKEETVGPKLRDIDMAQRQVEGVDFVNRKINLPDDIADAIDEQQGLLQFFNELSFSHKKEYVEHIVSAEKPETRERRIEKMIQMLSLDKAKKDQKKR